MQDTTIIHPRVEGLVGEDSSILDAFGMKVVEANLGICRINGIVASHLINAANFAHGSIAFAYLDTACAYALASLEVRGVTTNANISYVRGCQAGQVIEARVSVISRSKRVATLRGEVQAQTESGLTLVAHGSFVFQLIV